MGATARAVTTTCCIAGGGPAGLMLGVLLARAGVDVTVLEKHADFLRDFRGDTIHPSTLELMHELGLLDAFLKLPHQRAETLTGMIGEHAIRIADFRHLPTRCRFVAFMPQWDFLDFLADHGRRYRGFHLLMETEAETLVEEGGRIAGLRARGPDGAVEIRAALTVGADGRGSRVRDCAGLAVRDLGAPMDVLWMRLPRQPGDPDETFGRFDAGRLLVLINRGDYWQCALVIPKGGFDMIRAAGIAAFRARVAALLPFDGGRAAAIESFDDVKLLTVRVDRLDRWWRPGLLMIGDAAHAMSPVGGIGINLAIQDAVAAANLLAAGLRAGGVTDGDLAAVERRRLWPTRVTQRLQLAVQNRVISPVLASRGPIRAPWPARLFNRFPVLRRIPARLIGMGVRPEHIETPDMTLPAPAVQSG